MSHYIITRIYLGRDGKTIEREEDEVNTYEEAVQELAAVAKNGTTLIATITVVQFMQVPLVW